MLTVNSKTKVRVLVGVIILTILLFLLQQCKVLDWSTWQTFLPLIVTVIAMFVYPRLIRDINMARRKHALRSMCEQMVQIIKATNENNVAENIQTCLEIAEQIEEQKKEFWEIPVPGGGFSASVMKPSSFTIKNQKFMEKLTKFSEEDLEEDPVEFLRSYEQVYATLWF